MTRSEIYLSLREAIARKTRRQPNFMECEKESLERYYRDRNNRWMSYKFKERLRIFNLEST